MLALTWQLSQVVCPEGCKMPSRVSIHIRDLRWRNTIGGPFSEMIAQNEKRNGENIWPEQAFIIWPVAHLKSYLLLQEDSTTIQDPENHY